MNRRAKPKAKAKASASKSAKSGRDRRKMKRWKVAVLGRCAMPKYSEEQFDLEMWAKDVNEKGMQLEWSRGLNVSHVGRDGDTGRKENIRFDDVSFESG